MATLRHVASLALCLGCVRNEPDLYSTFPEPIVVAGPPGGEIDREWVRGSPDDGAGFDADASMLVTTGAELTASCTDGEIDATLAGYGEWVELEGYGLVWRPYATAVGVDFTPYETCGSWVWTEWGWTFACEWDWGWLPFHYGRWGWFDDYWAWVPGYEWSPGWVEWRSGGGYVGWRPLPPKVRDHRSMHAGGGAPSVRDHRRGPRVRDHRDRDGGPRVRDHREGSRVRDHRTRVASSKDWQWRFAATQDLGKPRIRAHLYKSLAEGLRVTSVVTQPPTRASVRPVAAASIMRPRLAFAERARDARLATPPQDRRSDPRLGGRLELAPVAPGARVDRRNGAGSERPPRAQSVDRAVYAPAWSSQPTRAAPRGVSSDPLVSGSAGLEVTPTTPTPSPDPRPTTQHPLHAPDRYTTQQPTVGSSTTSQPPIPQPPIAQPPIAPDRYHTPPPRGRAPDRGAGSPPVYSPPVRSSAPPVYAPPTHSAPPVYAPPAPSPPARSSPPAQSTYSPPRASTPTSSPPARSSPPAQSTYSPPRASTPTSSPPRASAPSGSARNHRR
jgi:hypothetical protein